MFLAFALDVLHQGVERFAHVLRISRYLVPKFLRERREYLQFFWIRCFVDTVHHCVFRFVFFLVEDEFGHFFVGQQHKLLNQLVRILANTWVNADWLSVLIQFEADFGCFEVHGPVFETSVAVAFSNAVQIPNDWD